MLIDHVGEKLIRLRRQRPHVRRQLLELDRHPVMPALRNSFMSSRAAVANTPARPCRCKRADFPL
jgi:hypothetical protein